jgi:drug/metabolite transporter (DMT)-like permease
MFRPKQYMFELFAALGLYGLLLVGANLLERAINPHGVGKLMLNLTPMLGVLVAAWVILRHLWRMDELQRRIQFDAISLSFIGTALITFGWGFAEGAGAPQLRAFAVCPIMGTLWGLGVFVAQRRYR